jgi:pimeloyl-ACP methyl ester carboxylesterase
MKKKTAVIYIPGLGDEKSRGQDIALHLFRIFGIKGYYFPIGWKNSGDYEVKLKELDGLIAELYKKSSVHLFAASAGASAAINSYSRNLDKVSSVSLVCGKIQNINKIHPDYYTKNPNFKLSVYILEESLSKLNANSRARILSIRPKKDLVVPPKDTIIEGAKNLQSFTFGHTPTIAHYLTVGLPRIVWWIKKNS